MMDDGFVGRYEVVEPRRGYRRWPDDVKARIHARLETVFARAVDVLGENRDKLDALTKALFDAQALDGKAAAKIMGGKV